MLVVILYTENIVSIIPPNKRITLQKCLDLKLLILIKVLQDAKTILE